MKYLFAIVFSAVAFAQHPTVLTTKQLVCPTATVPQIVMAIPVTTGVPVPFVAMQCVLLDMAGFSLTGASPLPLTLHSTGGSSGPQFVDAETPSGTLDGANSTFFLAFAPNPPASLQLYRNGLRQQLGLDYTLNGLTINFTIAGIPGPGELLIAEYRK